MRNIKVCFVCCLDVVKYLDVTAKLEVGWQYPSFVQHFRSLTLDETQFCRPSHERYSVAVFMTFDT